MDLLAPAAEPVPARTAVRELETGVDRVWVVEVGPARLLHDDGRKPRAVDGGETSTRENARSSDLFLDEVSLTFLGLGSQQDEPGPLPRPAEAVPEEDDHQEDQTRRQGNDRRGDEEPVPLARFGPDLQIDRPDHDGERSENEEDKEGVKIFDAERGLQGSGYDVPPGSP